MNPIFIAATGGSGTRVLVQILQKCNVFMGHEDGGLNVSLDAISIQSFLHSWLLLFIMNGGLRYPKKKPFTELQNLRMIRELEYSISTHTEHMPANGPPRWGFKNPRAMFLIPLLHRIYPDVLFIHMVRDGKDMAYSTNQGQTGIVGPVMLTRQENMLPIPSRCAVLWSRANKLVANYGETHMPGQYYRLRFEDLCYDPEGEIGSMLEFLKIESAGVSELAELVQPPDTIGRYREHPADDVKRIRELAWPSLQRFGYARLPR